MATGSNTSFHQEEALRSGLHSHAISFQTGAINSVSNMIPSGDSYGLYGVNNGTGNLIFHENSSIINSGLSGSPTTATTATATATCSSSGSLLLNSVPGLKHYAGLAVEWTEEEQYKLEERLVKFKDEPSIMKYVKIAAKLPDKTVRDVALRCRWMTRKRRKHDELILGRKGSSRKDKFVESSSVTNLPSTSMPNVAPYSFQRNQLDQNQRVNSQVLSSKANQLLEQNLQALNQIESNMKCLKLQDNIDLFCCARDNINNINVILNNMREFSAKMRQMQDLPVSIDQNLANSILPHIIPATMSRIHNEVQPKWESRY